MDEKYLSGFGAGLILISFGIIVSYLVASGVENEAAERNQTINFEQLEDLHLRSHDTLKNNPTTQEFRKLVGDTVDELKDKIVLDDSPLYFEIENSTEINGTG